MKIDNGKVAVSEAKSNTDTEFVGTATYAMHAGIAKGEINGQKAKLKLNMMKTMKYQKALYRLPVTSKELKNVEY